MQIKLFDSELKVMELLWKNGDQTAKQLADSLKKLTGWNKNTTYTVVKKCVDKGAIERQEPNFLCHALITREEVRQQETQELIDRMFGGSTELFVSSFFGQEKFGEDEIASLRKIVDDLK